MLSKKTTSSKNSSLICLFLICILCQNVFNKLWMENKNNSFDFQFALVDIPISQQCKAVIDWHTTAAVMDVASTRTK